MGLSEKFADIAVPFWAKGAQMSNAMRLGMAHAATLKY